MIIKLNETTRTKGSGRYEIPIIMGPEDWKKSSLQPFTNAVSKYVSPKNSHDSYDGDMSQNQKQIDTDEKFYKKVKNMLKRVSDSKSDKGDNIHGYNPETVKKYKKKFNMKEENDIEKILKEDLAVWFGTKKKSKGSKQPQGPWVNICRRDKNGKHPPCGRPKADDKSYPKCRAMGVARRMSDSQKKSACSQKRRAEKKDTQTGRGQKPVMTSYKPRKESLEEIIKKVLRESIQPR